MHILLIHQAFAAIDEPGGTRHHELALYLAEKGHSVTIIASPVSYLTGEATSSLNSAKSGHPQISILRPPVYQALHRSFVHRVFNFLKFYALLFLGGTACQKCRFGMGNFATDFSGSDCLGLGTFEAGPVFV